LRILPWCELCIWGIIVISNVVNIWWLINYINGKIVISNMYNDCSIRRLFIYHIVLYCINVVIISIHIIYLHMINSSNMLLISSNDYVYMYPSILIVDICYNVCSNCWYSICIIGWYCINNVYNNIEVIELLITPLHICPEWYLLVLYCLLKIIPSKCWGIYSIVISCLSLWLVLEYKIWCVNIRIVSCNVRYSIIYVYSLCCIYSCCLCYGLLLSNSVIISYCRCLLLVWYVLIL